MRCLVEGLGWAQQARRGRRSWPYWHVPGASAMAEARERLGPEPLKRAVRHGCPAAGDQATRGAWYRRWRLLVLDGTCLDVPDSPANQALGRSKSGRGEGVGAFPQVRVVGLVGGGTHAIVDAVQGPLCDRGADAGPPSWSAIGARWPGGAGAGRPAVYRCRAVAAMAATGAELVWRVKCGSKTAPKLPVDQVLRRRVVAERLNAGGATAHGVTRSRCG